MSEESARFHAEAEETSFSSEQIWEQIRLLNMQADWDVERMLPEVFSDEENESVSQERPERQ